MSKIAIKQSIQKLKKANGKLFVKPKDDITCFMLYYGRKVQGEESMESFLRQTYPHKKLLIVNTHPDPIRFEKEYPSVEVHNLPPDTFSNLNEKYSYALAHVKTKWWAPWDSDDIWLPWHLENLAGHISKTAINEYPRKIGISRSYFMFQNKQVMIGWQMWSTAIWETFDRDGKRGAKVNTSDMRNCDRQILYGDWDRYWIDRRNEKNQLSMIFRWNLPENHNRSASLGDAGMKREKILRDSLAKVRRKEPWRPNWRMDYVEKVKGEHETFVGIIPK